MLPQDELKVDYFWIHENYNPTTLDNDISILLLSREVNINIYTPVCLAGRSDENSFDKKTAWAYGETGN